MRSNELVRRLMTEAVLSIDISESAGEVLRQFAAYPVHHMPVVDDGRVVGMLSSADLMKLDAFLPRKGQPAIEYLNQHVKLETLMQRPPVTIGANDTVEQAASIMASKGIHALPVVDDRGFLVGIISTTDIINAALQGAAAADVTAGQDEQLHGQLLRAIEHAKRGAVDI